MRVISTFTPRFHSSTKICKIWIFTSSHLLIGRTLMPKLRGSYSPRFRKRPLLSETKRNKSINNVDFRNEKLDHIGVHMRVLAIYSVDVKTNTWFCKVGMWTFFWLDMTKKSNLTAVRWAESQRTATSDQSALYLNNINCEECPIISFQATVSL